eukprot:TRINITY_DN7861_c0_g1_i2.p1 TRINITY_DN7861_c0_g1~~TRINITY_DN7861_c0_g1_i2.p1  ORF type:complete len:194 (+),score=15.18 TRINITY_DN7861_c0_g1_i2:47-628(+)
MVNEKFVKFFSGYGAYHNHPVNKAIHIICIPLILFSLLGLFEHADCLNNWASIKGFEIDFGLLFLSGALIFYLYVDTFSGIVAFILYSLLFLGQRYLLHVLDREPSVHFRSMLIVHIISWLMQFVGHFVFEKRSPALFDNLLQIFVAPLFVIIEMIFMMGLREEEYDACEKRVNQLIENFRLSKKKKESAKSS